MDAIIRTIFRKINQIFMEYIIIKLILLITKKEIIIYGSLFFTLNRNDLRWFTWSTFIYYEIWNIFINI